MGRKKPIILWDPPASERTEWPQLSPGVDTSYPTLENLNAQQEWLGHIRAGRINVR